MKVAWDDPHCIVCLRVPDRSDPMSLRTDAHVVPESIGGALSAPFLWKRCNSEMGRMEAVLARDISVRRLVRHHLQERLPKRLVHAILSGEEYFVDHADYGRITAVVDENGFLQPHQTATVQDDKNALARALAELERLGEPDERKEELRAAFDQASPGEWVDIRPGYRIQRRIDWSETSFTERLNDPIVGHEVPLGISYLYLALCVRERVYDEALEPVRAVLRQAVEGDPSAARAFLPWSGG